MRKRARAWRETVHRTAVASTTRARICSNTMTNPTFDISTEMRHVPFELIEPNPWQPRAVNGQGEHLKQLADSIAANGLLQIPAARRHPEHPDRVQLAFGHSRTAAAQMLAADGATAFARGMPLQILDLTNRQMADMAAQENVTRRDLSAIELARAIDRYITDFGATQAAAGAVYGFASQASVSNLLRLLQLPEDVAKLVHDGQLPERLARALLVVAKIDAAMCSDMAKAVAKAKETDRESVLSSSLWKWRQSGVVLDWAPFQLTWLGKTGRATPPEVVKVVKAAPAHLPQCNGCPFKVSHDGGFGASASCMRPACYQAKCALYAFDQLQTATKKHKVLPVAEGEKWKVVYDGGYNCSLDASETAKLLAKPHESLRFAPIFDARNDGLDFERRNKAYGAGALLLVTVDADALKTVAPKAASKKPAKPDWQVKQERAKKQAGAVLQVAKTLLAPVVWPAAADPLLPALGVLVEGKTHGETMDMRKAWPKLSYDQRRAAISATLIEKHVMPNEWQPPTVAEMTKAVDQLAKATGAELPADWRKQISTAAAGAIAPKAKATIKGKGKGRK